MCCLLRCCKYNFSIVMHCFMYYQSNWKQVDDYKQEVNYNITDKKIC